MSGKLKDFLQMCYMAAIPSEATPSQRLEMYSQIYSQMQTYDSTATANALTLDEALAKMSETVDILTKMCNAVDIPILADAEGGYGSALNVIRTIKEYEKSSEGALYILVGPAGWRGGLDGTRGRGRQPRGRRRGGSGRRHPGPPAAARRRGPISPAGGASPLRGTGSSGRRT